MRIVSVVVPRWRPLWRRWCRGDVEGGRRCPEAAPDGEGQAAARRMSDDAAKSGRPTALRDLLTDKCLGPTVLPENDRVSNADSPVFRVGSIDSGQCNTVYYNNCIVYWVTYVYL